MALPVPPKWLCRLGCWGRHNLLPRCGGMLPVPPWGLRTWGICIPARSAEKAERLGGTKEPWPYQAPWAATVRNASWRPGRGAGQQQAPLGVTGPRAASQLWGDLKGRGTSSHLVLALPESTLGHQEWSSFLGDPESISSDPEKRGAERGGPHADLWAERGGGWRKPAGGEMAVTQARAPLHIYGALGEQRGPTYQSMKLRLGGSTAATLGLNGSPGACSKAFL